MPCRADAASVSWIDDTGALVDAVASWGDVIGLDTEFQRTDTFFPVPGLYQVISGEDVYFLDPLSIDDFSAFADVLHDPAIVKVMHACSEDLELIRHHLGVEPQGIFDTQLAYAFQNSRYSVSYANLVAALLGHDLGKHATRSNWLRRPLTEEQLHYAWEDVRYLPEVYEALTARLDELGRRSWFADAMAEKGRVQGALPDEYYRGVKKAWRLDALELGVLKRLCAWRERRAMAEDVPRNRVVWDEHLVEFARLGSLSETDVHERLPGPVARRYASELTAEHREGVSAGLAEPLLARPLSPSESKVSRTLRDLAWHKADTMEFARELLARKRDVEACIRHWLDTGELSPAYSGWRAGLIGEEFLAVLEHAP